MPEPVCGHILVVDDDRDMREMVEEDLARRGHGVLTAADSAGALELVRREEFDTVLTDLNMPGTGGLELCRTLQAERPDLPVVILTAFGSFDTAISALRAGAYDFVTKPVDLDLLALTLRRAVRHRQLEQTLRRLQDEVRRSRRSGALLGESRAMQDVQELIARIADLDSSVLITGESGTGKELVARALHDQSSRRGGRSSPSTARPCRKTFWRASSSATSGGPSPMPEAPGKVFSSRPPGEPCSLTRSASCRCPCSRSSCGCWRSAVCVRSVATGSCPATCASSPPPIATWRNPSIGGRFGRTSTTV